MFTRSESNQFSLLVNLTLNNRQNKTPSLIEKFITLYREKNRLIVCKTYHLLVKKKKNHPNNVLDWKYCVIFSVCHKFSELQQILDGPKSFLLMNEINLPRLADDVTSFSDIVNLMGSVNVLMPFELPALSTNSYVKSSLRSLIFSDVSLVSLLSGLLLPTRLQNTL